MFGASSARLRARRSRGQGMRRCRAAAGRDHCATGSCRWNACRSGANRSRSRVLSGLLSCSESHYSCGKGVSWALGRDSNIHGIWGHQHLVCSTAVSSTIYCVSLSRVCFTTSTSACVAVYVVCQLPFGVTAFLSLSFCLAFVLIAGGIQQP